MLLYIVVALVILANLIAFCMMGIDKRRAIKKEYRISEQALMICAACFGALGAYIGMQVFRHKTKHRKFTVGVPMLLVCQIVAAYFLYPFLL